MTILKIFHATHQAQNSVRSSEFRNFSGHFFSIFISIIKGAGPGLAISKLVSNAKQKCVFVKNTTCFLQAHLIFGYVIGGLLNLPIKHTNLVRMTLHEQLRFYLELRQMTAAELARRSNISPQTISHWLNGSVARDINKAKRVARCPWYHFRQSFVWCRSSLRS